MRQSNPRRRRINKNKPLAPDDAPGITDNSQERDTLDSERIYSINLPVLDYAIGNIFGRVIHDGVEYYISMVGRSRDVLEKLTDEQRRITGPCYPVLIKKEAVNG